MPRKNLSLAEARRLCLSAQGFERARPQRKPTQRDLQRTINQLGLLQLDFVNVLIPAHYLVLFSRLGAFDREHLHKLVYQGRDFIEHWAHEACIVPTELWPLLEYRRQEYKPWPSSPFLKLRGRKKYLDLTIEHVRSQGPTTAQDLPAVPSPRSKPGDWKRSVPRWALEHHFGHGNVSVVERLPNYQRVYDTPENLIDEPHFSATYSREDAQRNLLQRAAAAFGVATLHDLADYYRMSTRDAAPRLRELVEEGTLHEVEVESWQEKAYLLAGARIPRQIKAQSLLSPFDPVVWFRPRAERLFDFHYRIEIYVPANKRKWGYYVLPFLLDDRIVARVDLKADRKNATLLVLATHEEAHIDREATSVALAKELWALARWLGLDEIEVAAGTGLAPALACACRRRQKILA